MHDGNNGSYFVPTAFLYCIQTFLDSSEDCEHRKSHRAVITEYYIGTHFKLTVQYTEVDVPVLFALQ